MGRFLRGLKLMNRRAADNFMLHMKIDTGFQLQEKLDEGENVLINVEIAPPDGTEYGSALRLNPRSSLLSKYLKYCECPQSD